jgi:site-specific DNA-cytosine methylase
MNTLSHGGLPQNRARLYIVGMQTHAIKHDFMWPSEIPVVDVMDILDPPLKDSWEASSMTNLSNLDRLMTKIMEEGGKPNEEPYFIDINQSAKMGDNVMLGRSPTLTRTRAMQGGFYVTTHRRMLNTAELFRLQGFDPDRIFWKGLPKRTAGGRKGKVTEREVRGMIGNAMTVPVVGRVLRMACQACGLIDMCVRDPWHK